MTIQQTTNNLLDASKTYAVCYSENAGDTSDNTWSDSYIRLKVTKVASIGHHGIKHATVGHLPQTGLDTDALSDALELSVVGSLAGTPKVHHASPLLHLESSV